MKTLLLALCLALCACETTVKSRNGTTLLRHASDSDRLRFTYSGGGERISLEIDGHQPSKTIRAGGSVANTGLAGIIAAMAARGGN